MIAAPLWLRKRLPRLIEHRFLAMGTEVSIKLVAASNVSIDRLHHEIAEARQSLLDFGRSAWAWGNGELAEFNRRLSGGAIVEVPIELQALFLRAWEIGQRSGGLYEPRLASLVHLWGFDDVARLRMEPPPAAEIEALLAALRSAPPYAGGNCYGPAPSIGWDFGGIGKGFIVDLVLDRLGSRGIIDAVVDAGGNLAARGSRGSRAWRIGIRDPLATDSAQVLATLNVYNEAVMTHGDDQRCFVHQGRRYAHILDPASGWPVQGLRALTVVHPDAALADAGGAALFVAGRDGWRKLAARIGLDQVLAMDADGALSATSALLSRLRPAPGVRITEAR